MFYLSLKELLYMSSWMFKIFSNYFPPTLLCIMRLVLVALGVNPGRGIPIFHNNHRYPAILIPLSFFNIYALLIHKPLGHRTRVAL